EHATGVMPGRPTPDIAAGQNVELAAMSAADTRKRQRMETPNELQDLRISGFRDFRIEGFEDSEFFVVDSCRPSIARHKFSETSNSEILNLISNSPGFRLR